MNCRVGLDEANPLTGLAHDVATRAAALGAGLKGTILLGLDDPYCVSPGDPGPLIAVPLLDGRRPTPLARARIEQADVVVCCDAQEMARLGRSALRTPRFVSASLAPGGPLAPSSPLDRVAAQAVLEEHPELAKHLGQLGKHGEDPIDTLVMACLEAIVLVSQHDPDD